MSRDWFRLHIKAVEYTALAVGGIFAVTISAMANTNMSAAVWTTFGAVVLLGFGGACWWQKYLWDKADGAPQTEKHSAPAPRIIITSKARTGHESSSTGIAIPKRLCG